MRDRRQQPGIPMAFLAVGLLAFLGLVVVAVDIGRIAHTANEVQTSADSAATAAAAALLAGQNGATATAQASAVVGVNKVDGTAGGAEGVSGSLGYVDAPRDFPPSPVARPAPVTTPPP